MRFRLTRLADADLVEIAEYTARQWGEAQARKYAAAFIEAFQRLSDDPMTPASRARDDLQPGCRILTIEEHFIVYRRRNGTTEILRVLHRRMNLPLHRLS
ncbi:type II toxin-antitoxin system RelE/ParE family toxin [Elstera litoralis]|uniref:type II toxin-antitoxin system RelE/ParE family toxin n=1 Tax=Elstera litoralis TaxID=552518 RepID=UPI0009FE2C74|nr:type II toxin-antitoxin system RelE/ParE family toxin [Elstera litoralis]